MSKAISLLVSLATLSGFAASVGPAVAADQPLPPPVAQAPVSSTCGPCGCLQVGYDHHRVLESTYGTAFDPRNDDQTEPHYYWGRVRAYPRYFVDGIPVGVPGWCDRF
jgi:hypothetical protein